MEIFETAIITKLRYVPNYLREKLVPSDFLDSAKRFAKNCKTHVVRVAKRRESVTEAIGGVAHDSKLLKDKVVRQEGDRKAAVKYTRRGRKAYNNRDYVKAEECFQTAIRADMTYALAYAYLGHTKYQQKEMRLAVDAWNRAIEADPDSEGASKARRKLQHVAAQSNETIERLRENIRGL